MAENFYTILTTIGKAKLANAYAFGTQVNIINFAVGDGQGAYYNPTEDQTALKHEVWRGNTNSVTIDEQNPNWIVIETVIPSNIGGFTVREAGVFDDTGTMIAIGKFPETYKPVMDDGSAKDLYIKMILQVTNASTVTLKVDPSIVLATKKDIQNIVFPVTKVNGKTGDLTLKASDIKADDGTTLEIVKENFDSHLADNVNHIPYAVATGSANTYVVTLNPAPTSYIDGMAICVKINVASTGASTLNVNGLGAKTILDSLGNAITSGGLKVGVPYTLRYNGTNFIVQGKGGGGNATASQLLSGYTATVDTGQITGTMPNLGTPTYTPTTSDQTINGYVNNGKVKGDANLIASNILSGKSIFGVAGSVIAGKRVASGTVTSSPNNITSKYQYAGGTGEPSYCTITVSGLSFKPSFIYAKYYNTAYPATINVSTYEEISGDMYPKTIKLATYNVSVNTNNYTNHLKGDVFFQTATDGGFTLAVFTPSVQYTWYAIE